MTPPARALATALGTALLLARRLPSHRPVTVALALLLACSLLRDEVAGWEETRPLDVALFTLWQCAIPALVLGALSRRWGPVAAVAALLAAGVAAALLALAPAGPSPARTLWMASAWRLVYLCTLSAQLAAALVWLLGPAWRRPWAPAEVVALLLTASTAAEAAGPWLRPSLPLTDAWALTVLPSIATWGAVALYQGGVLWSSVQPASRSSSTPQP